MVDEFFIKELDKKSELLTSFHNHILIEIPFFGELKLLKEALFKLQNLGYFPILAHPERFNSIQSTKIIKELKERGAKMQLNALSLIGFYGKDVQNKSRKFLKLGLYDFIGTDVHSQYQLNKLKEIYLSKKEKLVWNQVCEKQIDSIGL